MNNKSISPVIAVVLLITITLTAAALLRVWYFGEQQESQERTSGLIDEKIKETEEKIDVESYDTNGTLYIRNTGLTTIDTDAVEIYEEGTLLSVPDDYTINETTVSSGEIMTVNIELSRGNTYKITTETGYTEIFDYTIGNVFLYAAEDSIFNHGDTTTITAVVTDNFGNRLGSGINVTFQTTLGTFSESGNSTYTEATNADGEATATLESGTSTGRAKISALAGNYTSMTSVTVVYWWDSDWSKRKKIMITENSGNDLTNYPVEMSISYDADMNADFSDLRFTDSQGNELDYWIEEKTDGVSATVWVETPEIPADSTATVYMYYGNAGVSSASDGVATFDWFDDFAGAHVIGDYTIEDIGDEDDAPGPGASSNWTIDTINEILTDDSNIRYTGTERNIGSIIKTGVNLSNVEIRFSTQPIDNDSEGVCFHYQNRDNHYAFGFLTEGLPDDGYFWFGTGSTQSRREVYWQDSASTHQTLSYDNGAVPRNSVTSFTVRRYNDVIKVLQEGTEVLSVVNSSLSGGDIGLFINGQDDVEFHPPFIIRSYIYPEPTYSIETEVSHS